MKQNVNCNLASRRISLWCGKLGLDEPREKRGALLGGIEIDWLPENHSAPQKGKATCSAAIPRLPYTRRLVFGLTTQQQPPTRSAIPCSALNSQASLPGRFCFSATVA